MSSLQLVAALAAVLLVGTTPCAGQTATPSQAPTIRLEPSATTIPRDALFMLGQQGQQLVEIAKRMDRSDERLGRIESDVSRLKIYAEVWTWVISIVGAGIVSACAVLFVGWGHRRLFPTAKV